MSRHASLLRPGRAAGDRTLPPVLQTRDVLRAEVAPRHRLLQRKPSISAPDDAFEREADATADRVLRMADPHAISTAPPVVQRKCAACEDDGKTLHAKRALPAAGDAALDTAAAAQAAHRGGHPLSPDLRAYFEPRFGHDFSHVRVHTDGDAAMAARGVRARAYTLGRDIVFGAGQFAPSTTAGRHLIAHELTHVVQQRAAHGGIAPAVVQRQEATPAPKAGEVSPLVQKFIRGEATAAEKETLRRQLVDGQMPAVDVDALKQHLANEFGSAIANQLRAQGVLPGKAAAAPKTVGQVHIDTGAEVGDVHRYYKARVRLHLSGTMKTFAGGLEGTAETTIEVQGDKKAGSVTVTIAPPAGETALVSLIRAKAFPNGPIVLKFGEGALKALSMVTLDGSLDFTVTGDKNGKAGGLTIVSGDLPSDVSLDVSVSQSTTPPPTAAPTGASVLPPPRVFVTGGLAGKPLGGAFRVGFDAPLFTDTKTPVIYGGLGARASVDTQPSFAAGGAVFVGAHLSPITVQLAMEAGVIRGPVPTDPNAGAKTAPYFGAEVSASYKVLKHVEIMALASIIGGSKKDQPGSASIQAGAGFTF